MSVEARSALRGLIQNVPEFISCDTYRGYCMELVKTYQSASTCVDLLDSQFKQHLKNIKSSTGHIIQTGWGGVDIITYEHPQVEKFLVVEAGKFLAFEKHDEKVETLIGEEGVGVLVYRPLPADKTYSEKTERPALQAEIIEPGWTITLQPGQEHTIIALSDLLVREKSQDYKGMDKDLIFIYMPSDE